MAETLPRSAAIQKLESEHFDLLVIGGGITGVGIARDAAMRGLSVALIEKSHFGSGTSSKSSKLIHGGIRYLEQFQFRLVKEACREREILLKQAPQLVWPLQFILPIYQGAKRGAWKIKTGLWLYDLYSSPPESRRHQSQTREQILKRFPQLREQGLKSGFSFYDAQTDDLELTRAVVAGAREHGCLALEKMQLIDLEPRKEPWLHFALVRDLQTNTEHRIRASAMINAAGPWVDEICALDPNPPQKPLLRLTKGVHLVFPQSRLAANSALLLFAPQDGRVFFVLPWKSRVMVGTTDTDFQGNPDQVHVEAADIGYLLEAVNFYFPKLQLTSQDIVETYAGLRPLLRQDRGGASQASREHEILESQSGLITVAGGKLTSYRKMAEQTVDFAIRYLKRRGVQKPLKPCQTAQTPLKPT